MKKSHLLHLAEEYGYPYYLYEESAIAAQHAVLRETLPDFTVLYSVKTNPHPAILRFMAGNGAGADAASSFEVAKALDAGFSADAMYYSAPGKTEKQIADAMGKCVLIADSYSELERLDAIAGARASVGDTAQPLPVGVRINPDMAFSAGEFPEIVPGVSTKFGIDEESLVPHRAFFETLRHIRPAGIHVFLRSQVLSHAAITASFEAIFRIALSCREQLGWDLSFINFGGGLGIAPALASPGLDTAKLRDAVSDLAARYRQRLPGCAFVFESGRFLVGRAGTFVSRIEDIKESRGKTYVITPGGLSGFLRPSVMNLLTSLPFPVQGPFEPLYSNAAAHQVRLPEKTDGTPRRVTVCGTLCTALDVLAADVTLPSPEIGDIITVSNAGAYAASLSPFAFASFPRPAELYRKRDGTVVAG